MGSFLRSQLRGLQRGSLLANRMIVRIPAKPKGTAVVLADRWIADRPHKTALSVEFSRNQAVLSGKIPKVDLVSSIRENLFSWYFNQALRRA